MESKLIAGTNVGAASNYSWGYSKAVIATVAGEPTLAHAWSKEWEVKWANHYSKAHFCKVQT